MARFSRPAQSVFFVALRYLLGRAKEGGRYLRGAAAGIALSLVPIIVTLIAADGMIRGISDRYIELGTGHVQVYDFFGMAMESAVKDEIGRLETVRGVWRERQGLGIILGKQGRTGATIRAVESDFWRDEGSARFLEVLEGSAVISGSRQVLLGRGLARETGAHAGDTVRIMTIRAGENGNTLPRLSIFTVAGIISSGYRELDELWCVMNYEAGEELLAPELYRSFFMVKCGDPYGKADECSREIAGLLGPGFGVFTWKELQQSLYKSFESTRQMLLFIMALLVAVAAVNVSSATSMLVIERQRDIGVLKAAGAGPRFIRSVFLTSALLTGLSGAALGIALGLILGCNINGVIRGLEKALGFAASFWGGSVKILDAEYYLETIPILVNVPVIGAIALFTLLCSCAASFLPARRAGKSKPLDILRRI
ncbi:MAG: ABC transporter permease [Treponema sp.]|jgi:lipoprotein-releasing system permease protein|nr:ABC transporter permease [Treponema sp.]